jgi:hypothetical protein
MSLIKYVYILAVTPEPRRGQENEVFSEDSASGEGLRRALGKALGLNEAAFEPSDEDDAAAARQTAASIQKALLALVSLGEPVAVTYRSRTISLTRMKLQ